MGRLGLLLCFSGAGFAQHEHMHMAPDPAGAFLMREASGTSAAPASAAMDMVHRKAGSWMFMLHGLAFLTEMQQTGPRGGDKLFSTNWFMVSAEHRAVGGTFQLRSMLSLEPGAITNRRYPELFQTGETAYGRALTDAQHPHDLFMELAAQYVRPLADKTLLILYAAPIGDPALGPTAFPHRISAAELPQATLSHHLQDSTHISSDVVTAGIERGIFRLEASGFHGAEPDEFRWNIDQGGIDSWSARLWVTPSKNWSAQVSAGRLARPEELEAGDVVRSTASVTYNRPLGSGHWAASLIWGRNHKTAEKRNLNSWVAESVVQFRRRNYVSGRVERVDKDELFPGRSGPAFRIGADTAAYTRDVPLFPGLVTGFGASFTAYTLPAPIRPDYGNHPLAFGVYMRVRLKGPA